MRLKYVPDKCTVTLVTEAFVDHFKRLDDETCDQRRQRISALFEHHFPLKKEHKIDLLVRASDTLVYLDVEKVLFVVH
ncbi:hypothetical protein EBZ37_11090 [bacterium]|nr:hypothetical protein [bacterium]